MVLMKPALESLLGRLAAFFGVVVIEQFIETQWHVVAPVVPGSVQFPPGGASGLGGGQFSAARLAPQQRNGPSNGQSASVAQCCSAGVGAGAGVGFTCA